MILRPGGGADFSEVGIRLAEALDEEAGVASGKRWNVREDEEATGCIRSESAQCNTIRTRTKLKEMAPMLERETVREFKVRLKVSIIAEERRAEERDARDEDAGNRWWKRGGSGACVEAALGKLLFAWLLP